MADQGLVNYIKNAKASGKSVEEIRTMLFAGKNVPEADIDAALHAAAQIKTTQNESPPDISSVVITENRLSHENNPVFWLKIARIYLYSIALFLIFTGIIGAIASLFPSNEDIGYIFFLFGPLLPLLVPVEMGFFEMMQFISSIPGLRLLGEDSITITILFFIGVIGFIALRKYQNEKRWINVWWIISGVCLFPLLTKLPKLLHSSPGFPIILTIAWVVGFLLPLIATYILHRSRPIE